MSGGQKGAERCCVDVEPVVLGLILLLLRSLVKLLFLLPGGRPRPRGDIPAGVGGTFGAGDGVFLACFDPTSSDWV